MVISMRYRILVGLVLVASLLSLRSLVLASGFEQTWIHGIYDAGDLDDAFALSNLKALRTPAPPRADASTPVVDRIKTAAPDAVSSRAARSPSSRAPPLA
jgi:hypothetical protein